jgi:subtilisin family serine protease
VINAAGNQNSSERTDLTQSLGGLPYVLTVAAVDDRDQKTSYSSYGHWVDVCAPGGDPENGRPAKNN